MKQRLSNRVQRKHRKRAAGGPPAPSLPEKPHPPYLFQGFARASGLVNAAGRTGQPDLQADPRPFGVEAGRRRTSLGCPAAGAPPWRPGGRVRSDGRRATGRACTRPGAASRTRPRRPGPARGPTRHGRPRGRAKAWHRPHAFGRGGSAPLAFGQASAPTVDGEEAGDPAAASARTTPHRGMSTPRTSCLHPPQPPHTLTVPRHGHDLQRCRRGVTCTTRRTRTVLLNGRPSQRGLADT